MSETGKSRETEKWVCGYVGLGETQEVTRSFLVAFNCLDW